MSVISIKHRLPLLIGTLLLGIIVAATWASYNGVKESALDVGRERLQNLTKQLAILLQQSNNLSLTKTLAVANDPAIKAFLQSPSPATRSGASLRLEQFAAPQDPDSLQVELWDTNHSLVLTVPNGASPVPADLEAEFKACSVDPFKTVGPMRAVRDTIATTGVVAVKDDLGKPIGYLVRWRRTSLNPPPKQLTDLLGSEAALYFGNLRGDLFTNLERVVSKPRADLGSTGEVMQYSRDGNRVLALGRPIVGTPWFLAIEFPEQPLLAPAHQFLLRILVADLVVFIIGMVGAFVLSRGITRPLQVLTEAASAIGAGDYSHRVDIHRGDELGVLANAFNAMVTKTQDAQQELEQRVADRTAQLQAVNKELEAFSYSVSHDLRAPLRHINGFSQALLEDYTDKLDDVGKNYLQEVRSASQEMAQLIDDVLELARVTRSEMRQEVVNLSDLARSIAAELKKREPKRKVILNLKGELETRGDKRLLRIVLNNLLGNAWKFTAKRREAQITFGREQKNGETAYFIRDNGAGFDMAYVGKLFGAFQRLHTAGEFEGTGIGLATVQRIVYRHGGRVWAEGAVNEGATFYFTLPNSKETGDGQQSDSAG